ncbi:MAG: hypothetical protein AAFW82_01855 [Pseudomonadota bacterium]
MLKNALLAAFCAAFLAVGPMAVVTSGTVEARTCQAKFVTAWGKLRSSMYYARGSAREAWKLASKRINGTKYDTWWPSKRKSIKCFTNREGLKRCRYRARPCTIA